MLATECGLTGAAAGRLVAQRPFGEPARLDPLLPPEGARRPRPHPRLTGDEVRYIRSASRKAAWSASEHRSRPVSSSIRRSGT